MRKEPTGILFLGLTIFSQTGGIEKFNKCFIRVLDLLTIIGKKYAQVAVLYDDGPNERYFNRQRFKGYKGNRVSFVWNEIWHARKFDRIIVGHINLAIVAVAIKFLFPRKKLGIIIHGIEAMEPITGIKKRALAAADEVWTVSKFTKNNLLNIQEVPEGKIILFHNTIDPFFQLPEQFTRPARLLQRYHIRAGEQILFSLTRLNHKEGYKGYDNVIRSLPAVLKKYPALRYLIAGKGDKEEIAMVTNLVAEMKLEGKVELLGYIPDEELSDHYLVSDLFVLPSKKEGFGIVFIEAMACGLPVIAGNKDGSVDALRQGELGTLIDPDSPDDIAAAILRNLDDKEILRGKQLQEKMLVHFGFDHFKEKLSSFIA